MVARVTVAEIDPVRQNPRRAIERFEAELIPALHEQDGYEGCYVLLSEEGKALVISLWSSEEAADASQASGFYKAQIEKLCDVVFYRASPGREGYDVVVADAPVTAR